MNVDGRVVLQTSAMITIFTCTLMLQGQRYEDNVKLFELCLLHIPRKAATTFLSLYISLYISSNYNTKKFTYEHQSINKNVLLW